MSLRRDLLEQDQHLRLGTELLHDPKRNKGTAFPEAERDALREREADLLRTLHVEQDAHDRLREQLAAREWRPVDEPPTETGDYLIGCDYAEDIRVAEYHAATELYFQLMDDGEWQQANWHTHWQPLPTPPQDDDR